MLETSQARPVHIARTTTAPVVTVNIFELPDFPGLKFFRCTRLLADLSPHACARNFRQGANIQCVGCTIGRHHAGIEPAPEAPTQTATCPQYRSLSEFPSRAPWTAPGNTSCIRCGQHSRTNERLIGRMRLVRETICVSCFNREREVVKGSNAKGGRPQKWAMLKLTTIDIQRDGQTKRIDIGLCSGAAEALRHAARRWPEWELLAVRINDQIADVVEPIGKVIRREVYTNNQRLQGCVT
jgi:hypothetical protein